MKEEKKYLKINMSTAICLVIIFVLIISLIGLSFWIIKTRNDMEEMKSNFDENTLIIPQENVIQNM